MKTKLTLKSLSLLAVLSSITLAGCGQSESSAQNTSADSFASAAIHVISRDEGSGTQIAFLELFGIEDVLSDAEISNSTSVVMSTVANDPGAIGYISLGSLNDTVKAAAIDGAAASVENVQNGSYKVKRPFMIVYKNDSNELIQDFLNYIHSTEGAAVIQDEGYVPEKETGAFQSANPVGTMTIGGSSSVTPLMEKLAEAYMKANPKAALSVMQSDSTVGITSANDGTYDIGMASRELKNEESSYGLQEDIIAQDGIAVILNKSSDVDGLTKENVTGIYTGEIRNWSDVK